MNDVSVHPPAENTFNSNSNDTSYAIKAVSFEDSQIDHFVPYSSPYVLCWHNNKERRQDVTLFNAKSTNETQASDLSEVERGRAEDLSTSNLVQVAAENSLNSTDHIFERKPQAIANKYDIKELECDKSSLLVHSQLQMLNLNSSKDSSNLLTYQMSQNSNDLLTNVTSNSHKSIFTSEDDQTSLENRQRRVNSYLTDQTPSLNLMGANLKTKSNLKHLFNANEITDSIKKKASSTVSENSSFESANYSSCSQKTNDMATSPIKFQTLSPALSLTPCVELAKKKSSDETKKELINETNHCENLCEKSVEKIEFSYSEISERSARRSSVKMNASSMTIQSTSSVTNITKENEESDDDIELDEDFLKLINKNIKKMVKKNFEKSKRMSMTSTCSSLCSSSTTATRGSCSKQQGSPIVKNNMQKSISFSQKTNKSRILGETLNFTDNSISLKNNFQSTEDKENHHHHQPAEVSTQTSFIHNKSTNIQEPVTSDTSTRKSNMNSDLQKRIKKEKIKEMLQLQKLAHEKRMVEHERLARIERLQAEKLKALMQESRGDSILDDSYFQTNYSKDRNETLPSQKAFKKLSPVEVINLKDTTVNSADGFLVVKESRSTKIQSSKQNNELPVQKKDRQVFSSVGNNLEVRRESIKYHSPMRTPFKQAIKPQAWFLPVTPHTNLPNVEETPKSTTKSRFQYTSIMKSATKPVHNESSHNMTLQEAFETHKRSLIDRSMQRQDSIQVRSQQRNQEAEFKRQHYENMMSKKFEEKEAAIRAKRENLQRLTIRNNLSGCFEKKEPDQARHRRRMSVQDIVTQNKKLYEKLPEVQQKQKYQRLEEQKRLNRMKSSIFKKSIQQKVLSNGPNFSLKYKAIDDL